MSNIIYKDADDLTSQYSCWDIRSKDVNALRFHMEEMKTALFRAVLLSDWTFEYQEV
jgi:hypothetical protein